MPTATIQVTSNLATTYSVAGVTNDSLTANQTKSYTVILPASGSQNYTILNVPNKSGYSKSITAKIGGTTVGSTSGVVSTGQTLLFTIKYTALISPTVSITNPVNNSVYANGDNIRVEATASDSDGTVSKVEFYNGATKLGEDNNSPYRYNWNNIPAGTYSFRARAIDNDGLSTYSSTISVVVKVDPTITFWASPSLVAPGEKTKLYWSNTDVTECHAVSGPWSGSWTGSSAISGNIDSGVLSTPGMTYTFTIGCSNGGSVFTKSDNVSVQPQTFDIEVSGAMKFNGLGAQGTSTPVTITIVPKYGFDKTITFSVAAVGSNRNKLNGSKFVLSQNTLTSDRYNSSDVTLEAFIKALTEPGKYTIRVTGSSSDFTNTLDVELIIGNVDGVIIQEI